MFPVGVPIFWIVLLFRYKVPQLSRVKVDNAHLRYLLLHALVVGVEQPEARPERRRPCHSDIALVWLPPSDALVFCQFGRC